MQVRIKICGITNPTDAELAASLGTDWLGLNFYAKSPRYIDEATAKSIMQAIPTSVEPVALFVNEPIAHMQRVAEALSIRTVQVHGFPPSPPVLRGRGAAGEGEEQDAAQTRRAQPSAAKPPHPDPLPLSTGGEGEMRWLRAFSVRDASDLRNIETTLATMSTPPTAILIDAHVPGWFGGTGQVAPWHLLTDFNPGVPIILAGGLTPDNVADAIRIVRPYAVDVASGVESIPGKKDAEKMRRFIDAVRLASDANP